jgi:hypothetical protein
MFATLLGPLPRPPLRPEVPPQELLLEVIRAQESAGLEPLIDGGFGIGATPVERWRSAAGLTGRPVKAVLTGPFTAAIAVSPEAVPAAAARGNKELRALAAEGCPYVEIHEPAATTIGGDETRRALFRESQLRLLDGIVGLHLSLAITGGSADAVGVDALLAGSYASLAVDLIDGPDNWRLVTATPTRVGIVCGALSTARDADDRPEILLWAADYAASTRGRGSSRVGLASASSMAHLPWDVAVRKLGVLGDTSGLAELSAVERRTRMNPRAVDLRSAALGRVGRPPAHRRRP